MARKQAGAAVRSRGKAVLRFLLVLLAGVAVLVGGIVTFHRAEEYLIESPRFALPNAVEREEGSSNIRIAGVNYASLSRIQRVFARDIGRSLYLVPLAERRSSVLAIDWVKDASVLRIWPDRLEVRIQERQPVAFVRISSSQPDGISRFAMIDADGVILEPTVKARFRLPVLAGIRPSDDKAERRSRVRLMQRVLAELGSAGQRISEVDVSVPENVRVTQEVEGQAVTLLIGNEEYLSRMQTFLNHYSEIRTRLPGATVFDLRLKDRITAVEGGDPVQ